MSIWNKR